MNDYDDMFAGGGDFAPGFKFANIGDMVSGEILSVEQQDQRDINDSTKFIIDPKTGNPKKQLKVVLQTALRDWAQVNKVPTDMETKQPRPASEDDGRRAIYIKGWMIGAVGEAVAKATGQRGAPRVGGMLAVRFTSTRDSGKPQPMKIYEAQYKAPAAVVGDSMFAEQPAQAAPQPQQQQQQQAAPVVEQAPQAAQPDPWATQQAQPSQQAPQAAQPDPWATGGDGFPANPPF